MYCSKENNPLQGLPSAILHPHVLLTNSLCLDISLDCLISHGSLPVVSSLVLMHLTCDTGDGCGHVTDISVDC